MAASLAGGWPPFFLPGRAVVCAEWGVTDGFCLQRLRSVRAFVSSYLGDSACVATAMPDACRRTGRSLP